MRDAVVMSGIEIIIRTTTGVNERSLEGHSHCLDDSSVTPNERYYVVVLIFPTA